MRRIFAIIALSFFIQNHAQIKFEKNLDETFAKAKLQNKAVFIEYYNETCSVCQKVAPILNDKTVGDFYNNLFISYKINTNIGVSEKDQAFLNKHKLHFKDVPNFVYFDNNENFLHYASGKADQKYITKTAKDAFNPEKQAANLANRIKNGDNGVTTLYEYSFLAQLNNNDALVTEIADKIFEVYNKEKLGNKTSYLILKNSVFTTQNGFFKHWIKNLDKIINLDTGQLKGREVEVLKNIISLDLTNDNIIWTDETLNNLCDYIVQIEYSLKPEVLLVDKRIELFKKQKIDEEIEKYYNPIISNNYYTIEDKIYILQTLLNSDSSSNTKKIIKRFAINLSTQTKDDDLLKEIYKLSK